MASATVTTSLQSHRASFSATGGPPPPQQQQQQLQQTQQLQQPHPSTQAQQLPGPIPSPPLPSMQLTAPPSNPPQQSQQQLTTAVAFDRSGSVLNGIVQVSSQVPSQVPSQAPSQASHQASSQQQSQMPVQISVHMASQMMSQIPQNATQMPSASQQSQSSSQQSFSVNHHPSQQGPSVAQPTYRPYSEPSQSKPDDKEAMGIYSAVYSNTHVYELEVHGVAVMRRRHDSWLNATQILKVAGVDKGKRTKILEKEIQTGEHEKIQGGYGKYQGTWICFDRGVEVCRQYGVEELLRPLLTYDMGQDGGVAGQGNLNTPTKEQAMAAQRKRLYNSGSENRVNGSSSTFFKGISNTASNMVGIISKARFDSPGPRNRAMGGFPADRNNLTRAPGFKRQPSTQGDDLAYSQQSFASDFPRDSDSAAFLSQTQSTQQTNGGDNGEPSRKRARLTATGADSFVLNGSTEAYANASAFPGSPTEPNESFVYSQAGVELNSTTDGLNPLPPLPFEVSHDAENKRNALMSLFMDSTGSDQLRYDILRRMTPPELDMPIDNQSHTALHWAATLSRMPLLRALIACGASPFRVNVTGETALMRACLVTNSHEHNSMPDLLDVLGSTIEVRDAKGRTVLHHIAVTSSVKGRSSASRYYLQCLLEWVVRQGSAPSSQIAQSGLNGPSSMPAKLGLARFMTEIVNAQDKAGDTALNIAAKIGNRSIISQLLEVCADPNLPNRQGLRPLDFGVGGNATGDSINGAVPEGDLSGVANSSSQRSRTSSDEIISSITHLLGETASVFQSEMKAKQHVVDTLHSSLRTTSAQLGEARRNLEMLQEKAKTQQQMRQKVINLSRARDEEQYRVMELEQTFSRHRGELDMFNWEASLESIVNSSSVAANVDEDREVSVAPDPSSLPSNGVLQARINALHHRTSETRQAELALKSRSREIELKFRRLVALATKCSDVEVDNHLDGLTRAVESEKGDLELGRVRRFLGGVEGVVH